MLFNFVQPDNIPTGIFSRVKLPLSPKLKSTKLTQFSNTLTPKSSTFVPSFGKVMLVNLEPLNE